MSDRCHACGASRSPGELLLVRPVDPRQGSYVVCRPSLARDFCLTIAGPRSRTTLELVDLEAADAFDRAQAFIGSPPGRST